MSSPSSPTISPSPKRGKASFEGQLALKYFENLEGFAARADLMEPFLSVGNFIAAHSDEELAWENIELHRDDVDYILRIQDAAQKFPVKTPQQIQELLTFLTESGTVTMSDAEDDVLNLRDPFNYMPLLSFGLYLAHPDVFLPYGFVQNYFFVPKVAETFGIALPPVPPKNDLLARWLYLGQLCSAFREFGASYEMTIPELLAFMYDFSPNYVAADDPEELPAPRNAWLLVGGGEKDGDFGWLQNATPKSRAHWQGNLDMRRGDACIMYVRSPISSIHSLWRVMEDGYKDPFFHYKHAIQIGNPIKLPVLHFRELATDSVFSENKYVKANLQGASGKALSYAEYEHLLTLLASRREISKDAPHFPERETVDLKELANERDVEIRLIEPFLRRAGLEPEDWVRQLPVRVGRGERVYPDYAIGVTGTAPELRARALVEAKYRAAGEIDWKDAFSQANAVFD